MSDWYRSGRNDDQSRHGSETRDRREFGGQDRWRDQQRPGEQRSFDERRPSPERGGYTGESFGGPDFMPQNRGGADFRGENYAGRGRGGQEFGVRDERWRGSQDDRNRTYGPEGRTQDWGHSYAQQGGQNLSGQSYGGQQRHGQERFGQGGGGLMGGNPQLERITDGETSHSMRENMGMGEHRGRGPKNYTRSDERIREDVNDRLSDDSWLDASEVEVQVSKCEVTLTGSVHSRDDKRRAEDLAEQVSGVKHVQNNLRIEQSTATQTPRTTGTTAGGSTTPQI